MCDKHDHEVEGINMKEEEQRKLIERYNERLEKYGYDPKTLGWYKGRQKIRFSVLTDIGDLNNCSILDVGCGFGDLYGYLINNRLDVDYTGYELNPKLVNIAKEIYPEAYFEVGDFEESNIKRSYDWVISSGIFNFILFDNESYIKNMLNKMYHVCNKGVAADFLSIYVDYMDDESYHSDPSKIFKMCKELSKRISIRHDYMPYEFCVYLYKNDKISENNVFVEYENYDSKL